MTTLPSSPITVMIVDDHALVREGIAALLALRPEVQVVAEAASGPEALALHRQLRPAVTLLDVRMPGMSGTEVLTALRREHPASRVIMLTTSDTDEDVYRALKAGAEGYLLKGVRKDELLEAIRAVHAGERRVPPALADRALRRMSQAELTARELEVLDLAARGLGNKEIATALGISASTVKNHLNSILAKLGASGRTEATTLALQRGLIKLG